MTVIHTYSILYQYDIYLRELILLSWKEISSF